MGKVQWKQGGDHDKLIKKLIKEGKINKFTKPSLLKTNYPILFGEFSSQVIRNHLNELKRSAGLYLDGQSEDEDYVEEVDKQINMKDSKDSIIESHAQAHSSSSNNTNAPTSSGCDNIHNNYPVLCQVFIDPDTQCEKVLLAVSLPSGAETPKVEVSDDGMTATVKYTWPRTLYDMEDLFRNQLASKQIHGYHPKVLCFKNGLKNARQRIDMAPESSIKVNLPIKVQTATDAWTKSGVRRENSTQIVMAEFKGYVPEYAKKTSDSVVLFDM